MERVLGPMPQDMLKRAECVPFQMNKIILFLLNFSNCSCLGFLHSRPAEKYVRRGRLNWPEGAVSRESIKAVLKLPRLPVCNMI